MKKLVFACTLAAASTLFAVDPAAKAKIDKAIEDQGGMVTAAITGRVVRLVNAQRTIPAEVFTNFCKRVGECCIAAPMEVGDATVLEGRDPLALVRSVKRMDRTGAVIAFVEAKDCPSMLVAPEDAWGIVNVKALKSDKPSKEVLLKRVDKELWRVLCGTIGGFNSQMGPCLMRTVRNNGDLDRLAANQLGPDATMKVMENLEKLGIEQIQRATYQQAVEEGWAPKPANEKQKAIWEKVHAVPTQGLEIKFDPKKGK